MTSDPGWDFVAAINQACPGVVVTSEIIGTVLLVYQVGGYYPLSASMIKTLIEPLAPTPAYPAGLPLFRESPPAAADGPDLDQPHPHEGNK